jgi:PAS domain S-box-containing protein
VMDILQAYLDRKLEQYVVEYRLRCKNGSYKWILARGQAQWDKTGKPIRMVGSHKDISERKLAELELHRREQEVRALVENSPDVIGRFDRQLRHLYVNPAAEIATGLPPEAFIGKTHRELGMPEEIVTFFQDALQSVFNTGKERLIEFGFPTPNGIQYYESRIVPEFNPDGTIETVLKVARNITDRRLAEEALQKNNIILRSLIDSTPDVVFVKDIEGRYVVANSALVRWLAQPMEEVIGKDDTAFFEPEIARQFMEADKRIITTGESVTYEEVLPEKGIMRMWLTTKCPWRDADGNILGVVGISRDISDAYRQATQRQLAEQKLRETTFLYQQILDAIPDFILCKGSQSRIIYANKAFRDYYGMTMEQLQGIIDSPIVNPDYTQQYVKDDAYVFNTGQTLSIEEPVVRYDGEERLFSTVKSAIRDGNGQVIQTVGLSRDITERKLAEVALRKSEAQYRAKVQELETAYRELQNTQAQLIQAEKMSSLGQMLAGIAHEINNPTSFIYGNITPAIEYAEDLLKIVELYRQYYPEPVAEISEQLEASDADFIAEDFPKLLVSIKEGANRISQIVLSLRNFSRLDEKERQRVDIHEGIDNTLLLLKHRLKQQPSRPEIQIIKEYGELPLVECYPSQLNQVFMNILSNAIDALEDSNGLWVMDNREESANDPLPISSYPLPTIWIYSEVRDRNSVTVRIVDNGSGMTPEVQQNVFNPFFTTKPLGKGTGLGLAISYQIVVEKHSGRLECFSTQGQGTEFLIYLPIESPKSNK